jgi:hypothetical protein
MRRTSGLGRDHQPSVEIGAGQFGPGGIVFVWALIGLPSAYSSVFGYRKVSDLGRTR